MRYYRNSRYGHEGRKLYRSRYGLILGVCQGIATWAELPVWVVRVGVIILAASTAFFPVAFCYLLAALLMEPEPVRGNY
ncbi:PspC domain-containing protein [Parasphaerochaeta coccoides]|uniref:PspC domain protein n=1 Tax=Parasphaerochaeta coccoides (strain ATCC BAA-1237 / DSM 17374 / SPN1) TaxID=760011 RepID=F4GJV5_PARC1|nr:PspC domain-containing protein [Parasphaerochaeta coccoides]AEC01380.1 PspC domain protein [Parasphaerochaeta coccoides DSM 17374]